MHTRFSFPTLAAVALVSLLSARPAQADWLLTPFAGVSFGGATTGEHLTYGASVSFMSAGIFGLEIDGSIAPDLLSTDGDLDLDVTDSSATTLMANIVLGAPLGSPGVRPYVTAGAGLLRLSVDTVDEFFNTDNNSFGVNVGGGIIAFVANNVGIRADVRYFRSLREDEVNDGVDLGSFDFWRATLGATFRF